MVNLDQALAFTMTVHGAQKSEGLWLAQHPFVQAVRIGSARHDEIQRWVGQIICANRAYREIFESLSPQPAVEPFFNARRDLDLLIQLGEALGVPELVMATSEPNFAARSVEAWMRERMAMPAEHSAGPICWALVEAMSPETGGYLAEGAEKHFGLGHEQVRYFTIGMKSKLGADEYAAKMLSGLALDQWDSFQEETLVLSRLLVRLCDSIGDIWSAW